MTIAAARDGRLWLVWDDRGSVDAQIRARRSNKGATRWGAEVVAGRPSGTLQAYRLDANAAGDALDVLGVFNLGTSSDASTFHRRLLPGLTLAADPGRLRRGRRTKRDLHGPRRRRSREGRQGRGGRRLRDDQPPRQGGARPARARGKATATRRATSPARCA